LRDLLRATSALSSTLSPSRRRSSPIRAGSASSLPPISLPSISPSVSVLSNFFPRSNPASASDSNPLKHYCPHQPTPQQAKFLALDCREALYGGAAGGGKSDALLMAALQYVHVPGYAAILFRRTFQQLYLADALIPRSFQWLAGSDAVWNGERHQWTFPSGATLTFGFLDAEQDRYRYQGAAFQTIGFDELTQFPESVYRYLFSRLRRLAGFPVPLRVRGATNPGGIGHEWVRARFGIPDEIGLDPLEHEGRVFVPARLGDNPHLDRDEYRGSLRELDPLERQQLEFGLWNVKPAGKKFRREWFEGQFLDWDELPRGLHWVRYWDKAATEPKPGLDPDWTIGTLMGERDGRFYVADVARFRGDPGATEDFIALTRDLDHARLGLIATRMEQEPGSSGKGEIDSFRRRIFKGYDFDGIPSTGSKEVRANPFAAACRAGNVYLVRSPGGTPWLQPWLDVLCAFPTKGVHDDDVDSASGAHRWLSMNAGNNTKPQAGGTPRIAALGGRAPNPDGMIRGGSGRRVVGVR
jgi:predicted phage terminase large subunit-like protein